MRETIFGQLVPDVNYSDMEMCIAISKACRDADYILCAAQRIGKPFTPKMLQDEIIVILITQSLERMVQDGIVEVDGYGDNAKFDLR